MANKGIIIKNVPVEVHHSLRMVKYYYKTLQQVYFIITIKILDIKFGLALYISFKAINILIGLNGLVIILLIFDTYPRMIE